MPRLLVFALLLSVGCAGAQRAPLGTSVAVSEPGSERGSRRGAAAVARRLTIGDAPVTIVAFSDFQCPYCARGQRTVAAMEQRYGDAVQVVLLHQPLAFHHRALPAAHAAAAAARQGRYAAMCDALFARARRLGGTGIEEAAEEAGLDMRRFRADRRSADVMAEVAWHMRIAKALGVRGTPTFFINGTRLNGAQPPRVFERTIDAALARARSLQAQGLNAKEVRRRAWDERPSGRQLHDYLIEGRPVTRPLQLRRITRSMTMPRWLKAQRWQSVVGASTGSYSGAAGAPVTLVVFTDLQCPFCMRLHRTLKGLTQRFGGQLHVVLKHQPLSFHRLARPAAIAAVAAARQGKLPAYVDAVFGERLRTKAQLRQHAATVGLDMVRFDQDLADPQVTALVDADRAQAEQLGARGTPTMFLNGQRILGAQPVSVLVPRIQAAIANPPQGGHDAAVAQGRLGSPLGPAVAGLGGLGMVLVEGQRELVLAVDPDDLGQLGLATHLIRTAKRLPRSKSVALRLLLVPRAGSPGLAAALIAAAGARGPADLQRALFALTAQPDVAAQDVRSAAKEAGLTWPLRPASADALLPGGVTLPGTPALVLEGHLLQPPTGYHPGLIGKILRGR